MGEVFACRDQFPSLRREVAGQPVAYLDGPGGTQVPQSVIDAISDYYKTSNANTHGLFAASRETDGVIYGARQALADLLGATDAMQISLGQNMTTMNFALARAFSRKLQPGDEVIVTKLDHDSNVAPWLTLERFGVVVKQVPVLESASLDMDAFKRLMTPQTKLVAVGYASNAVGTVNDIPLIRQWTREVGAQLVVDAVHFAPHGVIDVVTLDVDFLLCSVYKFFGPHIGVLYSKPGALDELVTDKVRPQLESAPEKIETGTLNHAALAGATAAVNFLASFGDVSALTRREKIISGMRRIYEYEHELARRLYQGLQDIPGVTVYGPPVGDVLRAPTVSFTLAGVTSDKVAEALGDQGIYVWNGDFYAMTLVKELGIESIGGLVRVGMAPYNTVEELERVLATVGSLASQAVQN
ncbi:cysteine desulfurase-like protein [Alicyclobacillus sp. ALC3]|uniref:cysteine desulfurase-like protein n=1 Tax=Alicyclobacillus sp. ALC3 TaxID=2796143 RepID=UPI0023789138|nr:cysteine desulfurase-like protein [Alicyclobacillus sp. ALC3]WDL99091.1 cysteine desulfurase-like protein [Alicyclobacillus sp. ALC3]